MPNQDGTGPMGHGSKTGQRGICLADKPAESGFGRYTRGCVRRNPGEGCPKPGRRKAKGRGRRARLNQGSSQMSGDLFRLRTVNGMNRRSNWIHAGM